MIEFTVFGKISG